MKASDIPAKIQLPFGASAGGSYIRTVPVASQIGVTAGAWSYTDGSVPLNFEEVSLGGVPPDGRDFNGLLNVVSAHNRWAISGGPVPWDGAFSTAIGGYPMGAIVQSATTFGTMWVCLADNNTTNPDTGGANWQKLQDWLGITAAIATGVALAVSEAAASPSAIRASVRYDGVAKAVVAESNIASVTYNGVGDYTINFTTPFTSATSYTALGQVIAWPGGPAIDARPIIVVPTVFTAGSVRVNAGVTADSASHGYFEDCTVSIICVGS